MFDEMKQTYKRMTAPYQAATYYNEECERRLEEVEERLKEAEDYLKTAGCLAMIGYTIEQPEVEEKCQN